MDPGPEPGTPAWSSDLVEDVEQAQRNEADREYVVMRRLARIRRATGKARDAEILALAEVESVSGLPAVARERLRDVLGRGKLPDSSVHFVSGLVSRLASTAHERGEPSEAVALFEAALGAAIGDEAADLSVALLCGKASLHVRQRAPREAESAATEGLRRLGWGIGPDPYRGLAKRSRKVTAFEQDAIVSLVSSLATTLCYAGAFEDASQQLAELRAFLQSSAVAQLYEQNLRLTEAWLDHRRGDYASAERKLGAAYDHAIALNEHETASGIAILINLGWAYLEQGLLDQASGVTKLATEVVERNELNDRDSLVQVCGLRSEVALAKERFDEAKQHAEEGLAYVENRPDLRAGGLRILAACAFAQGDEAEALRLAKESVDLATDALGEDLSVVDELLMLARVAVRSDRTLAEATLNRAAAIPMPASHPRRTEIERIRAELSR